MRLALVQVEGVRRAALVEGQRVRLLDLPPQSGYGRSPTRQLLECGWTWRQLADRACAESLAIAAVELVAPVPDPSFLAEVDRLTYLDQDMGSERAPQFRPIRPVPDTAIGHPGGTFHVPRLARRIHVDVQIACVVGRPIRRGEPATADAVFGYTIMSSCRELGFDELVEAPLPLGARDRGIARLWQCRWRDGSHPLGPWIAPPSCVDFSAVVASLSIEGVGRAVSGPAAAFDAVHTLAQVTPLFAFQPGDVVGLGALTAELVVDGPRAAIAEVEAEVEGLGRLQYSIDTARWDPAARYRPRYRPHIAEALDEHVQRRRPPR